MKFDELPSNIQDLVKGRTAGEFLFRPTSFSPPSAKPFVHFWQVHNVGLAAGCELIQPRHRSPPNDVGTGLGFAKLAMPAVISDPSRVEIDPSETFPVDPALDLYEYPPLNCFVTNARALDVLTAARCVHPGMTSPIKVSTSSGIEAAALTLIDFRRAAVIDYARSGVMWKIYSTNAAASGGSSSQIYFPEPRETNGEVEFAAEAEEFGIARETHRPDLIFIRRDILATLRAAGINGPDYSPLNPPPVALG